VAAVCLAVVLGAGCGQRVPSGFSPPGREARIEGVPFHPQEPLRCGPASLAGVMNYWGLNATEAEIARDVQREDIGGSVSLDLALWPRSRGYNTRWFRGTAADILAAVDAGLPLLVMLDYGFGGVSIGHYMVVTGYRPDGVIANTGRSESRILSWGGFLDDWAGTDYYALLILPEGREFPAFALD